MATINVQDVAKEVGEFVKANPSILSTGVYSEEIILNKYCKTITAVKGKFPQFHKILTRVVQGFKAEWQALGEAQFKHKMLQNFRQKVNFAVVPDEILHTWLANLYTEGKTKEEQPISKEIMEDLMGKVIDDLQDLSISAEYDAAQADGNFGKSLDGINTQVTKALADTVNPAFKIPVDAITSSNRIDVIKQYEKGIPSKMRKKVKRIFVSDNFLLNYADDYEMEYGTKVTFKDEDTIKTPLSKMEIVGLPGLPDDRIFSCVEGIMARLIDVIDKPRVTDVQVQDYVLKIFMDWFLGYDFIINQLVYVAVFDGSPRGLGDATQNSLYYDSENLQIV